MSYSADYAKELEREVYRLRAELAALGEPETEYAPTCGKNDGCKWDEPKPEYAPFADQATAKSVAEALEGQVLQRSVWRSVWRPVEDQT